MTPSPTTPASRTHTGLRSTNRAQRVPMLGLASGLSSASAASRALRPMIHLPATPSRAGTRVSATRTAIATVPAAAKPIFDSIGMLTTARPTRAMTTVRPAKTTADPAVPTARPAASSRSRPSASSAR